MAPRQATGKTARGHSRRASQAPSHQSTRSARSNQHAYDEDEDDDEDDSGIGPEVEAGTSTLMLSMPSQYEYAPHES